MEIIAKILDVSTRNHAGKQYADVIFKTGGDVISCTMFDKDVQAGKHRAYQDHVGQIVRTDVRCQIYRDELQYQFGFEASCLPVSAAAGRPPEPPVVDPAKGATK